MVVARCDYLGMFTYVAFHSVLALWRLPKWKSGGSVRETQKGLRRLRLGVSGLSHSIPRKFLQNIVAHLDA